MSHDIVIKEVTLKEALRVHAIIPEFKEETPPERKPFEERLREKEHTIIVAYISNNPVGYTIGYGRDSDRSFYCWMAGVIPSYRNQGVLTAMMEYLENWAKKHNYTVLKIKTRSNRKEMLSYLIKHNFGITEVEECPRRGKNRIHLQKSL